MTLDGYNDELRGYNTKNKNTVGPDADMVKAVLPPLGCIMAWCKTFGTADSGTTSSTSAGHLVQAGQNFLTTVQVGMIVYNTTDATFSYVTAVNSDTDLSIHDNIMASGEDFTIYKTPWLPDGFVECNGQVLSDGDSPYNGETIPDLNVTKRFLRGALVSGATGGSDTHSHTLPDDNTFDTSGGNSGSTGTSTESSLPAYYEVVWIMRVK